MTHIGGLANDSPTNRNSSLLPNAFRGPAGAGYQRTQSIQSGISPPDSPGLPPFATEPGQRGSYMGRNSHEQLYPRTKASSSTLDLSALSVGGNVGVGGRGHLAESRAPSAVLDDLFEHSNAMNTRER